MSDDIGYSPPYDQQDPFGLDCDFANSYDGDDMTLGDDFLSPMGQIQQGASPHIEHVQFATEDDTNTHENQDGPFHECVFDPQGQWPFIDEQQATCNPADLSNPTFEEAEFFPTNENAIAAGSTGPSSLHPNLMTNGEEATQHLGVGNDLSGFNLPANSTFYASENDSFMQNHGVQLPIRSEQYAISPDTPTAAGTNGQGLLDHDLPGWMLFPSNGSGRTSGGMNPQTSLSYLPSGAFSSVEPSPYGLNMTADCASSSHAGPQIPGFLTGSQMTNEIDEGAPYIIDFPPSQDRGTEIRSTDVPGGSEARSPPTSSHFRPNIMTAEERAQDDSRFEREKQARMERRRKIAQAPIRIEGFPEGDTALPRKVWDNNQVELVERFPNHLYGETLKRLVEQCGWKSKDLADRAGGGGGKITRNAMGKRVAKVMGTWKGGKATCK